MKRVDLVDANDVVLYEILGVGKCEFNVSCSFAGGLLPAVESVYIRRLSVPIFFVSSRSF